MAPVRRKKSIKDVILVASLIYCVFLTAFAFYPREQEVQVVVRDDPAEVILCSNLRQQNNNDLPSSSSSHYTIVPNRCDSPSRKEFESIYELGVWQGVKIRTPTDFYNNAKWPPDTSRQRSASGEGSNLGHTTETSLRMIKETIHKFNIKSMIDIPCGDANWIFDSYETDTLPLYVGLDVATNVLKVNKQRFAHHSNKQFHFWDATACEVPKFINASSSNDSIIKEQQEQLLSSFELVHVRDVIQHMTPTMGIQFFCNVFRAQPKVLITVTYPTTTTNVPNDEMDVANNPYKNNLLLEPFNFPNNTAECTPTHPQHDVDSTCVYDLTEDWVQEFVQSKC